MRKMLAANWFQIGTLLLLLCVTVSLYSIANELAYMNNEFRSAIEIRIEEPYTGSMRLPPGL